MLKDSGDMNKCEEIWEDSGDLGSDRMLATSILTLN